MELEVNQPTPWGASTNPSTLDLLRMAQAQQEDAKMQAYRTANIKLVLADLPIPNTDTTLLCDTSTGALRPTVPLAWWRAVFNAIHGLGYPGTMPSMDLDTQASKQPRRLWQQVLCCMVSTSKYCGLKYAFLPDGESPATCNCTTRAQATFRPPLPKNYVEIVGPLTISQGEVFLTIINHYTQ